GAPPVPVPAAKAAGNLADLRRWAELRRVELRFPPGHPRRTVDAMRLLAAAELYRPDAVEPLTHALFRAYWVQGRDVADRAMLGELAAEFGLAIDLVDRQEVKDQLRATTDEAVREGVFGAPSFIVETAQGRRMIFGQDRLHFLEQAIRGFLG